MKKLFTILLVTVLTGCGSSPSVTIPISSPSRTIPTSNADYENIIGTRIKIGNLKVAQYDFPNKMLWDDTKKACEALGNGWRLPNKDELNTLYSRIGAIGGFSHYNYWSSTEVDYASAWYQSFGSGNQSYNPKKYGAYYVRAIRTFK
jgi:hypothetical protein